MHCLPGFAWEDGNSAVGWATGPDGGASKSKSTQPKSTTTSHPAQQRWRPPTFVVAAAAGTRNVLISTADDVSMSAMTFAVCAQRGRHNRGPTILGVGWFCKICQHSIRSMEVANITVNAMPAWRSAANQSRWSCAVPTRLP